VDTVPLQQIYDKRLTEAGISLGVLRLDKAHGALHGNKWFKLKYNLDRARSEGKNALLTFGGAYSNHIYAFAAAGKQYGFRTYAVIRGEKILPLNPTLSFAEQCGTELCCVTREMYRDKAACLMHWKSLHPGMEPFVIPEGGSNAEGVKGCTEIVKEIEVPFSRIVCACGTGATLAGISLSLGEGQAVTGIPVLKGGEFLEGEIRKWTAKENWELITDYHFGGYAKTSPRLLRFIQAFGELHQVPLDPVYTGKMMYAVMALAEKGHFIKGERLVAIHSGGLQGALSA
jgi:1-aminocyclopropane-1-carboxylate deaminase/D-cysteine desulfhydrase-like pyridoxal-dependent ACC family enzyme